MCPQFAFGDLNNGNLAIFNRDTNIESWEAFCPYTEPFYAECRVFGRLYETGYQDLALRFYGYVLLDRQHEDLLRTFTGRQDDIFYYRAYHQHSGSNNKPRIRYIVKELGGQSRLTNDLAHKLFNDIRALHSRWMEALAAGKISYGDSK